MEASEWLSSIMPLINLAPLTVESCKNDCPLLFSTPILRCIRPIKAIDHRCLCVVLPGMNVSVTICAVGKAQSSVPIRSHQ